MANIRKRDDDERAEVRLCSDRRRVSSSRRASGDRRRRGSEERGSEERGSEERSSDVAGQGAEERPFDIEGEVNNLRYLLARASAMGSATQAVIEVGTWGSDADEDRRRMEDLSHLVGAGIEALLAATVFGDQLAAALAKHTATRIAAALATDSLGGA
jgi:hypothetical protein